MLVLHWKASNQTECFWKQNYFYFNTKLVFMWQKIDIRFKQKDVIVLAYVLENDWFFFINANMLNIKTLTYSLSISVSFQTLLELDLEQLSSFHLTHSMWVVCVFSAASVAVMVQFSCFVRLQFDSWMTTEGFSFAGRFLLQVYKCGWCTEYMKLHVGASQSSR